MKKYLILFIFLFNLTTAFADPPIPVDPCPCCEEFIDEVTGTPLPGMEDEYDACYIACQNAIAANEDPCPVPIDSAILVLVVLGASLGIFKVYQNKKRQFEN